MATRGSALEVELQGGRKAHSQLTQVRQARRALYLRWLSTFGPFVVLLALWVWLFLSTADLAGGPNGRTLGVDFSHSYAAARALQTGSDPYLNRNLVRAERSALLRQGISEVANKDAPSVLAGHPPFFYSALEPLSALPFQTVAMVWIVAMYMLSGVGFFVLLQYFGWKRRLVPTAVFMAMPRVVLGAFYGNVIGLLFLSVCCSLALLRRAPILAGVIMSFAWVKPQVALPVALLIALFHAPRRLEFVGGFGMGSLGLLLLTAATSGWQSVIWWIRGMTSFTGSMTLQPNLASLSGLYAGAPAMFRTALEALSLGIALGLTAWCWWKHRHDREVPFLSVGWLWIVWFLATPYAHFADEILLAAPILALLGRDGYRVLNRLPMVVLYLMLLSLLLFSWSPMHINFLFVILLALIACFAIAARSPNYSADVEPQDAPLQSEAPSTYPVPM